MSLQAAIESIRAFNAKETKWSSDWKVTKDVLERTMQQSSSSVYPEPQVTAIFTELTVAAEYNDTAAHQVIKAMWTHVMTHAIPAQEISMDRAISERIRQVNARTLTESITGIAGSIMAFANNGSNEHKLVRLIYALILYVKLVTKINSVDFAAKSFLYDSIDDLHRFFSAQTMINQDKLGNGLHKQAIYLLDTARAIIGRSQPNRHSVYSSASISSVQLDRYSQMSARQSIISTQSVVSATPAASDTADMPWVSALETMENALRMPSNQRGTLESYSTPVYNGLVDYLAKARSDHRLVDSLMQYVTRYHLCVITMSRRETDSAIVNKTLELVRNTHLLVSQKYETMVASLESAKSSITMSRCDRALRAMCGAGAKFFKVLTYFSAGTLAASVPAGAVAAFAQGATRGLAYGTGVALNATLSPMASLLPINMTAIVDTAAAYDAFLGTVSSSSVYGLTACGTAIGWAALSYMSRHATAAGCALTLGKKVVVSKVSEYTMPVLKTGVAMLYEATMNAL